MSLLLRAAAALATLAPADESPLLGKPLPRLELSYSLQGQPWSTQRLRGRVVVIEFFQLGCAACWSNSLPAAQKMLETYAKDDRVAVVAIATAFEKEKSPWIADEERIRAQLASKRFTFPVMRDKNEQSIRNCGFVGGSYGTPMTLVVDAMGVVRWHALNPSMASAAEVEAAVAEVLQSFWVEKIAELPAELDAYAKGDYPKAHAAAQKILADAKADPKLRDAATLVEKNLAAGVTRLVEQSAQERKDGYPGRTRARLEDAVKLFPGIPGASDAADRLSKLRADPGFTKELSAEKALENALESMTRPHASRDRIRKALEEASKNAAGTPLESRIEQAIASLR
jgi:alkyl hydroperoxide reductase subunit AhpC